MPPSNYPNGFPNGLVNQGIPVLNTYAGNVFWVDSGTGSNGNKGTHLKPFETIDYAVGRCTANNGDIIMVKPGHTETISGAAGIAFDVAGVTVVGLGNGSDRPTLNFTATTSTVTVTAANVTLKNLLLTGGIDAIVTMIAISAADCTLLEVETRDVTGQMVSAITTATGADRLLIDGYAHRGAAAAGGANAIELVGADDGVTIRNFWIDGNFSAAAIQNVTGVMTNLSIYGDRPSYIRNRNSADVAVTAVATSTGNIGPNIYARIADDAANITEAFVGADMQFFQPIAIANADGEVGLNTNITASVDT